MLPIEIYKNILRDFSLHEKIELERVCRGWKNAMPYREERIIELSKFKIPGSHFFDLAELYPDRPEEFEFRGHFVSLILESLTLRKILSAISQRCPNIEEIDLQLHCVKPLNFSAEVGACIDDQVAALLLEDFPNLKKLRFHNSVITSGSFNYLQNLRTLVSLSFTGTRIVDPSNNDDTFGTEASEIFRNFIEYLPSLTELSLDSPEFLPEFSNHRLKTVSISNVGLKFKSLFESWLWKLAKNCSNIMELSLQSVPELESFSVIIRQLPNLRSLSIHGTDFPSGGLSVFCRTCPRLKRLHIAYCSFSELDPSDLRSFRELEEIWINHWTEFGSEHLGHLTYTSGKTLRKISVKGSHLTNKDLRLFRHCRKLEYLRIHKSQITPVGLVELLKLCPTLTEIDFGTSPVVSNDVLGTIGEFCPKLQKFVAGPSPSCLVSKAGLYSLIGLRKESTKDPLEIILTAIAPGEKSTIATLQTLRKLALARIELKFRLICP